MHTFTYNNLALTWQEYSSGEHAIVVISGHGGVRQLWEPLVQSLLPMGRCITLDLPGHYPSPPLSEQRRLSQYDLIDIETQAIKHICRDQPVTLIGHSTGALVALAVAAQLPEQVRRVISINGLIWGPPKGILGTGLWALEHNLAPLFTSVGHFARISPLTLALTMSLYMHRPWKFQKNRAVIEACRTIFPYMRLQSWESLAVLLRTIGYVDIRPLICDLTTPILAIVGGDDRIVPPEQSFWLARHLPHVELAELPAVGHMVNLEATQSLECMIVKWLSETLR